VKNPGTVYIVDDDEGVRRALSLLMRSVGLNVAVFDSAVSFLAAYDPAQAGCLLLDVRMPGMSGLELQERLRRDACHLPIIIMTGHGDVPMAVRAMKGGAVDFVEKSAFNDQSLLERVQAALRCDEERRAHAHVADDFHKRAAQLSPREKQVMELFVQGKAAKVIAYELGLSTKTVETHRSNVMDKMGVRSLVDLTRLFMEAKPAVSDAGGWYQANTEPGKTLS
jgi:FixJ family two-component response regulator